MGQLRHRLLSRGCSLRSRGLFRCLARGSSTVLMRTSGRSPSRSLPTIYRKSILWPQASEFRGLGTLRRYSGAPVYESAGAKDRTRPRPSKRSSLAPLSSSEQSRVAINNFLARPSHELKRPNKMIQASPLITLNNGVQMPALGLGVLNRDAPERTADAVECAIADGY